MKKLSTLKLLPQERKAINAFSRRLKKALGKQLLTIKLFGSKTRGNFHKNSDIDIYILVKKRKRLIDDKIAQITADILDEYNILLSPVSYDQIEENINLRMKSFFFEAVKVEGITL